MRQPTRLHLLNARVVPPQPPVPCGGRPSRLPSSVPMAARGAILRRMAFVPTTRHLLRAKDLADARYFEPLTRRGPRPGGGAVPRPLQPRLPGCVRRVAARISADAAARAGRRAAAEHRSLGRRDLLLGRSAERRLVHDELHAHLRRPHRRRTGRQFPPAAAARRRADVRRARIRPAPTPHKWRRQGGNPATSLTSSVQSDPEGDR